MKLMLNDAIEVFGAIEALMKLMSVHRTIMIHSMTCVGPIRTLNVISGINGIRAITTVGIMSGTSSVRILRNTSTIGIARMGDSRSVFEICVAFQVCVIVISLAWIRTASYYQYV